MKKLHLVRRMKKYGDIRVANAMYEIGYSWKSRTSNIDRLVGNLPRVHLVRILNILEQAE